MADEPQGCARLTGAVIASQGDNTQPADTTDNKKEKTMAVHVGQKAPDFAAPAYCQGKFNTVKLSDYSGKWLLLCFYPGDFTFV